MKVGKYPRRGLIKKARTEIKGKRRGLRGKEGKTIKRGKMKKKDFPTFQRGRGHQRKGKGEKKEPRGGGQERGKGKKNAAREKVDKEKKQRGQETRGGGELKGGEKKNRAKKLRRVRQRTPESDDCAGKGFCQKPPELVVRKKKKTRKMGKGHAPESKGMGGEKTARKKRFEGKEVKTDSTESSRARGPKPETTKREKEGGGRLTRGKKKWPRRKQSWGISFTRGNRI